ncbi:MAG: branched-chain amino acid ABC transporter permease [Actinomycetia bacterium]|nr:branched-chain amino acid ABC transporter permease [Actinomycetes bacterium]
MFFQQIANGLILGSQYTLIALGLTMIYGILGIINFAHGELFMIGAFVGYTLTIVYNLNFFLALLLSMFIMAVIGIVIEMVFIKPLRNLPVTSTIIGTIGVSIFLLNGAILIFGPDPKRFLTPYVNKAVNIAGVAITQQRLFVFFISIILIVLLGQFIKKTKLGKAMRATSQNYEAANLMGIDIDYIAKITLVIGSALAGAAGTLIGPIFLVYPQMSIPAITKAFVVVILGGLGNVEGAIFSGFILGITESLTAGYFSSYYKDIVAFLMLILILLFKPEGIFGKHIIEKV